MASGLRYALVIRRMAVGERWILRTELQARRACQENARMRREMKTEVHICRQGRVVTRDF